MSGRDKRLDWVLLSRLLIGVCGLALCSCGSARPKPPPLQFEVISREEQIVSAVDGFSPTFMVPYKDDDLVWNRARYFFGQYTPYAAHIINKPFGEGTILAPPPHTEGAGSEESSPGSYSFVIEKTRNAQVRAYLYTVACTTRSTAASAFQATRNGKNLARFMKDGEVELSLFVP